MAGNKVIAVDLGGSNLRIALVENNKILKLTAKKTPMHGNLLVRELISGIESLISKDVKGIGVGSAGPLLNGVIKNPPNLPLRNFNLKKTLENKFKIRVEVENDANCAALAEAKLGVKKRNFFMLTLGTGIGGGVIIDGKLYVGGGYGGELGHIILDRGKDFENLAAWRGLRILTKKTFGRELKVIELLKMKDTRAEKILDNTTEYLAQGIGSLINVFDPEVVVLSGGVSETGDKFLNMIKKKVPKYSMLPKKTPIVWSRLREPNVLGASLLLK